MDHDHIVARLDDRCDRLEDKMDKVTDKVDVFVMASAAQQKDISWLRGSVKLIATLLLSLVGIIITAYIKTLG